jgi:hypothetical protein
LGREKRKRCRREERPAWEDEKRIREGAEETKSK